MLIISGLVLVDNVAEEVIEAGIDSIRRALPFPLSHLLLRRLEVTRLT